MTTDGQISNAHLALVTVLTMPGILEDPATNVVFRLRRKKPLAIPLVICFRPLLDPFACHGELGTAGRTDYWWYGQVREELLERLFVVRSSCVVAVRTCRYCNSAFLLDKWTYLCWTANGPHAT